MKVCHYACYEAFSRVRVMRQKSKGPWSLFAEEKFTPLASKP